MMDDRRIPEQGASPTEYETWRDAARERRAEALKATDRARAAVWRRGLLEIMIVEWAAVALMLWSFHTGSHIAGVRAFWGALVLGNGGFLVILFRTWRRSDRVAPW